MTIGELSAAGQRLAMFCAGCSRFRYMNLNRYEDATVVSEIGATLICSRCLSRAVEARAVERDPKTGHWPAEFA
jgi:hypothetical protein